MQTTTSLECNGLDSQLQDWEARLNKLQKLSDLKAQVAKLEGQLADEDAAIIDTVCAHFQLKREALFSKRKPSYIAMPRQIAYYLLCREADRNYSEVGRVFAKDHGTIMYGVRRVQNLVDTDKKIRCIIEQLKRSCRTRLAHTSEIIKGVSDSVINME